GDGPLGGQPFQHRTGGTENDRGIAAQEDVQTFFFHWRMKTADDAAPGVTPLGGLVVGGEDDAAGATGGTEQRGFRQGEQVEVAQRGQFFWSRIPKAGRQQTRPAGIVW